MNFLPANRALISRDCGKIATAHQGGMESIIFLVCTKVTCLNFSTREEIRGRFIVAIYTSPSHSVYLS
jgi:hypothetical protein